MGSGDFEAKGLDSVFKRIGVRKRNRIPAIDRIGADVGTHRRSLNDLGEFPENGRDSSMAGTEIRRRTRTTLLEQLSLMEPTSLHDHLKFHDGDYASSASASGSRTAGVVTLASMLESEKRGGRTLLDILREDDEAQRTESTGGGLMPLEAGEGPPVRASLMTLLALTEGDGADDAGGGGVTVVAMAEEEQEEEELEKAVTMAVSADRIVCCVCMVRRKGAAFIPCGHTFCRACTRELWTGRGSCPLCNAPILDILDIF